MFDTIQMKINPISIPFNQLQKCNPKIAQCVHQQTGAVVTKYQMKDEIIPFIKYEEGNQTLTIQVSIPKILYGNNVQLLKTEDIPRFFTIIQERINQLFEVKIDHHQWQVIRLDVCWNFYVKEFVEEYIRLFSKQKLPYKDTHCYNHKQTIEFRNNSSRIIFYDKQVQCQNEKEAAEIIEKAKGILRMEIKPSYHVMRKYSKEKRAIDLLTEVFFTEVTKKALDELEYSQDTEGISPQWLKQNKKKVTKLETYIGFQHLKNMLDETTLKEIYTSGTLTNRKSLAKKMTIPKRNCLNPLQIDYTNIR